ncbi:DTW domain-containing protein [Luteimonas sp. FCS-9]|uniref:tRNA-uridine aminocarboxypropyltransferase n=1 Tax=Luteimonas sp. FCS-9 TaxID=1547516 RepID=UPI0009E2A017|nr:DTW domain-containing protein [Luteimonas sp. FCS-9]
MTRPRCPRCLRPVSHCLCAWLPDLPSRSRVLLLQHPDEAAHPLNTARLAALGLRRATLWVGERFPELPAWLDAPGVRPLLLFPGEAAVDAAAWAATGEGAETLLVVPDGTWRKARRLLRLNPALAALPRLALAPAVPSRYRVRRARAPDALATVEAVAAALDALEPGGGFEALLAPFDVMVEGQIMAREARAPTRRAARVDLPRARGR